MTKKKLFIWTCDYSENTGEGKLARLFIKKLNRKNEFNLINPGSVGQNRQFINEINFLIYDTKSAKVDFRSILYNVDQIIDKMKSMKYPKVCLDYYMSKSRK